MFIYKHLLILIKQNKIYVRSYLLIYSVKRTIKNFNLIFFVNIWLYFRFFAFVLGSDLVCLTGRAFVFLFRTSDLERIERREALLLVSSRSSELLLLLLFSLLDRSLMDDLSFWLFCEELELRIELFSFLGELVVEFSRSVSMLFASWERLALKDLLVVSLKIDSFDLLFLDLRTVFGVSTMFDSEPGEFWFEDLRIESGKLNSTSSLGNGLPSFSFYFFHFVFLKQLNNMKLF